MKDTQAAIKTSAIQTISTVVACCGKADQLKQITPLFIERLDNETLRLPVLQGVTKIARSEQKCDLSAFVQSKAMANMCSFLRQVSSKIRHQALICGEALMREHSNSIKDADFTAFLQEASGQIGPDNLYVSHLVAEFAATAIAQNKKFAAIIAKETFPVAIELLKSPLLQGAALKSLRKFFQHCVIYGDKVAGFKFDQVLNSLLAIATADLNDKSFPALAQCIATISLASNVSTDITKKTVKDFVANIKSGKNSHTKMIALLSIGEVGRSFDLAFHTDIEKVIFSAFSDKDSKVGSCASFALGSIAIGDMPKFLPVLLNLINTKKTDQFLLLSALKDTIRNCPKNVLEGYLDNIIPILNNKVTSADEGTRNMVSECLGCLAAIDMEKIMPPLEARAVEGKNDDAKSVFLNALRFSFNSATDWNWTSSHLTSLCQFLKDPNLNVRHEAVITVSALFNRNASIVSRELLSDAILPALYAETTPKKELIKEVNLMGLIQVFDEGLQLRKAVFFALESMLAKASDRINLQLFLGAIKVGLTDHNVDVVCFVFHLFNIIAKNHSSVILEFLEDMPKALLPLVKKHKAMKDQVAVEVIRAILESMLTWNTIPGIEVCSKYTHFFKQVENTGTLKAALVAAKNSLNSSGF